MEFILGAAAGLAIGFLLRSKAEISKQDEGLDEIQRIAILVENSTDVILLLPG
ncbi:hypothetical protein [Mesobacillus thioparans]|uniref:hypothetical protein n=1 Tax=Mesobacillus thioparans TaxID=370439 RepID=UPI0039F06A3F